MSEHPTVEPVGIVRRRASGPWCDDRSGPGTAAVFTDLVCADHDLLRAEFVAIIDANFPNHPVANHAVANHPVVHPRRRDPTVAVRIGTGRFPTRLGTHALSRRPGRVTGVARHPRARQRGPPGSRAGSATTPAPAGQEVIDRPTATTEDACGRAGRDRRDT